MAPRHAKESMTFEIGRDGHYRVPAVIGDEKVVFMVDTGASIISLPATHPAARFVTCERVMTNRTANGTIRTCAGKIPDMTIGNVTFKGLQATVMPDMDGDPLLGMSVLSSVRWEQENGRLTLSVKAPLK